MHSEVQKFKQWATRYPESKRFGEWECNYGEWKKLYQAVLTFLATVDHTAWTEVDLSDLLYAIARDNEAEYLVAELSQAPERLLALSTRAVESAESDAKWQLAVQLGELPDRKVDAEVLLLRFVADENEYVSRRALLSLGKLKSSKAEALAKQAWETGHEYQRIAALGVLQEVGSTELPLYVQKAKADGRATVIQKACEIQKGEYVRHSGT
jgi:hypothetical protein